MYVVLQMGMWSVPQLPPARVVVVVVPVPVPVLVLVLVLVPVLAAAPLVGLPPHPQLPRKL